MTKMELITAVAKKTKIRRDDVKRIIDTIVTEISSQKKDKLSKRTSGRISVKRMNVNPPCNGYDTARVHLVKRNAESGRFLHVTDPAPVKKILKTLKIPSKLAIYEKLRD